MLPTSKQLETDLVVQRKPLRDLVDQGYFKQRNIPLVDDPYGDVYVRLEDGIFLVFIARPGNTSPRVPSLVLVDRADIQITADTYKTMAQQYAKLLED